MLEVFLPAWKLGLRIALWIGWGSNSFEGFDFFYSLLYEFEKGGNDWSGIPRQKEVLYSGIIGDVEFTRRRFKECFFLGDNF